MNVHDDHHEDHDHDDDVETGEMATLLARYPQFNTPPAPQARDRRYARYLDRRAERNGRTGLANTMLDALQDAHHNGGKR